MATDRALQSAAAAGLTPQGTRGVLAVLARRRLVKVHGLGRAQLYELNTAHPLALSLASLFQDEQSRWDVLMSAIPGVLALPSLIAALRQLSRFKRQSP